jgi:hypothetical protein
LGGDNFEAGHAPQLSLSFIDVLFNVFFFPETLLQYVSQNLSNPFKGSEQPGHVEADGCKQQNRNLP